MSRVYAKPKEVKQNRSTITVETIPPELKALHQWVCWKYGEKRLPNGKRAKPLINPKTGQKASSTNPDTWHTYDQALSRFRIRKELHGIGFVFANNGYVGIDLDDCVQNGVLRPDARKMLTLLNSYTELSPSGTGLHIIVKGCKPDARCRPPKEIHNDTHSGGGGIEVYDSGRYLTMTGNVFEQYNRIEERDLTEFYRLYFGEKEPEAPPAPPRSMPLDIDDQTLLEKAMKQPDFQALWNGDWNSGRFPSQSEADFTLCRQLAYWTGNDPARLDRLFRQSGLMRPKWDTKHGQKTYGQRTIENAIKKTTTVYDPTYRSEQHASHTTQLEEEPHHPQRVHIDLTYTITEEQTLIALQESRLLSIGNMMGIVSGIGIGKSHVCELFAALWLNPHCEPDGSLDVYPEGLCLYIDTERTANDCFKGFQRIYRRVEGSQHPNLLNKTRTDFRNVHIESFISVESPEAKRGELGELIHQYGKQGLKLLIIDGILDLCINPNSIEDSTRLGHRLLGLANQYQFGILYTIHGNRNDSTGKGKGWIGDVFQRKSESFLRLARDPDDKEIRVLTTDFENRKIRSGPDDVFAAMKWSTEQGMFIEIPYSPSAKHFSLLEKFQWAFAHIKAPTATFTDFLTFYKEHLESSKSTLQRDLKRAIEKGFLTKDEESGTYTLTGEAQQRFFEDLYPL